MAYPFGFNPAMLSSFNSQPPINQTGNPSHGNIDPSLGREMNRGEGVPSVPSVPQNQAPFPMPPFLPPYGWPTGPMPGFAPNTFPTPHMYPHANNMNAYVNNEVLMEDLTTENKITVSKPETKPDEPVSPEIQVNMPSNTIPIPVPVGYDTNAHHGTWSVNSKLNVIIHNHADGTPCSDILQHTALAHATEDNSYIEAQKTLANHFTKPILRELETAKAEIESQRHRRRKVEDELDTLRASLENSRRSLPHSSKRKINDSDRMDVDNDIPPPKKVHQSRLVPIGYHTIGQSPFPNIEQLYTCIQYGRFRLGFSHMDLDFTWSAETGLIVATADIIEHVKRKKLPRAVEIDVNRYPLEGSQSLPRSLEGIEKLVEAANQRGNLTGLYRFREAHGLALLLDYLTRESRTSLFIGDEREIIKKSVYPQWAVFTTFINPEEHTQDNDGFAEWEKTPSRVPALPPANTSTPDDKFANYVFVHYEPRSHAGIIMTDSGFVDLDTIAANRTFTAMVPQDHDLISIFKVRFVELVAKPGLYEHILRSQNIRIDTSGSVAPCARTDIDSLITLAKHFAHCGITLTKTNSMLRWAWQYCIDIQSLSTVNRDIALRYARVFQVSRYRSLFYPIAPANPSHIYSIPEHWDRAEILEYRRRSFVYRALRDSGLATKRQIPKIPVPVDPPLKADVDDNSSINASEVLSQSKQMPLVQNDACALTISSGSVDSPSPSTQPSNNPTTSESSAAANTELPTGSDVLNGVQGMKISDSN
ncbi:hypothetical protein VKT23_015309 [Stygiomarasmius scandens]|uniref:Uncharacterized protein n=1 Tax=Marasmiellus scandens TaxID=2682957 RepID=A0ABR1J0B1_9AGAR